jgi:flagellar protein FliO/FliZ
VNRFLTLLANFSLLFVHELSLAADNSEATVSSKTLSNSPLNSTALVETLLGLGTVLAIIVLLAWLIRRTGRFQGSANGEIKMIAGLPLGTRERAVLLEVDGERILVGVTPQQIRTLHVLGQSSPNQQSQKSEAFDHHLQDILNQDKS